MTTANDNLSTLFAHPIRGRNVSDEVELPPPAPATNPLSSRPVGLKRISAPASPPCSVRPSVTCRPLSFLTTTHRGFRGSGPNQFQAPFDPQSAQVMCAALLPHVLCSSTSFFVRVAPAQQLTAFNWLETLSRLLSRPSSPLVSSHPLWSLAQPGKILLLHLDGLNYRLRRFCLLSLACTVKRPAISSFSAMASPRPLKKNSHSSESIIEGLRASEQTPPRAIPPLRQPFQACQQI